MKKIIAIIFIHLLPLNFAFANCDLTKFRWGCDMQAQKRGSPWTPSLVRCGDAFMNVSRAQFDTLTRYQRANVNFVLKVNGDFVDEPCVPVYR